MPAGLIICQDHKQNLVKCCTCNYSFIFKDTNQDELNEEIHRAGSRRVPSAELLFPLFVDSEHVTLQENHLSGSMEFLLGFYYGDLIDCIIDHVRELSLRLTLLPLDLVSVMELKASALSSHGWFFGKGPAMIHLSSIKSGVAGGSTRSNKTLLSLGKFQGFRSFLLGLRTETRQNSSLYINDS